MRLSITPATNSHREDVFRNAVDAPMQRKPPGLKSSATKPPSSPAPRANTTPTPKKSKPASRPPAAIQNSIYSPHPPAAPAKQKSPATPPQIPTLRTTTIPTSPQESEPRAHSPRDLSAQQVSTLPQTYKGTE